MMILRFLSPDEQGGDIGAVQPDPTVEAEADTQSDDLADAVTAYRNLLASMPGLVPEMVQGSTITEVDASAEVARQAYTAISQRIAQAHETYVPTGNPSRSSADLAAQALKPEEKIALGLRGK